MAVHTLKYVRRSSAVLTSTILAAASHFLNPEIHQSLSNHAQTQLKHSIGEGMCNLELIQSILVQVYWKSPKDSTAWLRVGVAIRMAYQLRLHEAFNLLSPEGPTLQTIVCCFGIRIQR
jgi:hypothetical protein